MKNYQHDKYLAFKTKSASTVIKLAKLYNITIPKAIKNIEYWGKRVGNAIERKQFSSKEEYYSNAGANISKGKPKGNYKLYLDKTGLHDTSQSKQNFKDIENYVKIGKKFNNALDELKGNIPFEQFRELANIVRNKTSVKDYLNNTSNGMLKHANVNSKIQELKDKISDKYIDELIKRGRSHITEKELKKLKKKFNSKSIAEKIIINNKLYDEYYMYYQEYDIRNIEFSPYETINKIIDEKE